MKWEKVILLNFFLLLAAIVNAQAVYKTPSGNKFHLATCRSVKNVSEKITIDEAYKLGLTPCKICKPAIYTNPVKPAPKKEQGTGAGVQCKGLTKAGARCRHFSKIANGYCFQHQPK